MLAKFNDTPAVLTRDYRVRVIDISESGCLVEIWRELEVGTVGALSLRLGSEEYVDDIQVVRCLVIDASRSIYHAGMRFLWTKPRHAKSIRHAVARRLAELAVVPEPTRVM